MNVKYPIHYIDIDTFINTKCTSRVIKGRLYPSQTPKVFIIGCVEHNACNGTIKKSPFNFEHFGLNKILLYHDGDLVPGQIFFPNYDNNQYLLYELMLKQ